MSSVEKTIKIIKRKARESIVDQTQGLLRTDHQSRREMAAVVTSWIEERRQASTERSENRGFLFDPS